MFQKYNSFYISFTQCLFQVLIEPKWQKINMSFGILFPPPFPGDKCRFTYSCRVSKGTGSGEYLMLGHSFTQVVTKAAPTLSTVTWVLEIWSLYVLILWHTSRASNKPGKIPLFKWVLSWKISTERKTCYKNFLCIIKT